MKLGMAIATIFALGLGYIAGVAGENGVRKEALQTALHTVRDGNCPTDPNSVNMDASTGQAIAVACYSYFHGTPDTVSRGEQVGAAVNSAAVGQ